MNRRFKQVGVVVVVLFVVAQFVRPSHVNPAIDADHTIQARLSATDGLGPVLNRACGDCHSNATVWPWYTNVAPLSWVMTYGVAEGRKAVNFSEWSAYQPVQQRALLARSCQDATEGKMPDRLWTTLHPEARLSAEDVALICGSARQVEAEAMENTNR